MGTHRIAAFFTVLLYHDLWQSRRDLRARGDQGGGDIALTFHAALVLRVPRDLLYRLSF